MGGGYRGTIPIDARVARNGLNGGGSLIRDMRGKLTMAYSLVLGAGTSDWAKAASLLYGITW
ncbi:hypothetical protein KY284_012754 [Solanum tuberosum]|nr:hypothetical protein KY284_012754 [Solanum tuberosum]